MGEFLTGLIDAYPNNVGEGHTALLIVNQDTNHAALASLVFHHNRVNVSEVNEWTGAVGLVFDDSPRMPGLQLRLEPGAARLLVVP